MTREKNDTQNGKVSQATFEAMVREQLQQAVRTALISVLEAEVEAFIGAVRGLTQRAATRLSQWALPQKPGDEHRTHRRSARAAHAGRLSDTAV